MSDYFSFYYMFFNFSFRVDPSARIVPYRSSGTLCRTVVEQAVKMNSTEVLDLLSEYTGDVSVAVNLDKLAKWMNADNEEEFKKMLSSLPLDLVSETDF